MEHKQREFQMCENCKAPSISEFKKVVGLRNSGLLIYLHKEKLRSLEKKTIKPKKEETFILHNASDKELKRSDYIVEMCQYRTKCFQCKTVVQRVRSLLDEITDIKRNEVLGVCEHCKRANPSGKCRRCEYIVNKFLCNKVKVYEERQQRFKSWITKVNQFLNSILVCENVCKHRSFKDTSTLELEKLLEELRSPLEMRQPDISFFPTEPGQIVSMAQSKDMLEELLIILKSESFKNRSSNDSLFVSPSTNTTSCICKYFMDKKLEEKREMEGRDNLDLTQETLMEPKSDIKTRNYVTGDNVVAMTGGDTDQSQSKVMKLKETPSKDKSKTQTSKEKTLGKENLSPSKESKEKTSKEKSPKEGKSKKPKIGSEEAMMLKMMKQRAKEREKKEKSVKLDKAKEFKKVESLPQLKKREVIEVVEVKSESVVECGHVDHHPTEMIKGIHVVPFDPHYRDTAPSLNAPLLYRTDVVCSEPEEVELKPPSAATTTTTTTTTVDKEKKTKSKKNSEQEALSTKGVIKYELSNRDFIEKGWTILPTTKLMRRMNIYKMIPATPQYDWFERHKYQEIMFYDTGEKLAEITKNGRGKWFYKNGIVALDYYNTQEQISGQRYVIYSSGEEMENGKTKPITVLASFDFVGNGVVYDHYGNVRLKYNQTEGLVVDEKIGPPGRWKWHSLNEPPTLQPVFIDSYLKEHDPCLKKLFTDHKDDKSDTSSKHDKSLNAEMLAIELENFAKEKAHKMLQKFVPYQIRMKAMKINEQFSLKILDQAKIYLIFRNGPLLMKLNLGMLLISTDIIDTETAEMSQVATPYDRVPPKTPSLTEIQRTLKHARMIGKARNKPIPIKNSNTSKMTI